MVLSPFVVNRKRYERPSRPITSNERFGDRQFLEADLSDVAGNTRSPRFRHQRQNDRITSETTDRTDSSVRRDAAKPQRTRKRGRPRFARAPEAKRIYGSTARRCRSTSYRAIATLVERLSDRTCGDRIGMVTNRSRNRS